MWSNVTPTMTSVHTLPTTTLTSIVVTCTTVGALHLWSTSGGLTSVHSARQAYVSWFVEPSGSFPRASASAIGQYAVPRNFEASWSDVSTRSNSQPEFDRDHVASRHIDKGRVLAIAPLT